MAGARDGWKIQHGADCSSNRLGARAELGHGSGQQHGSAAPFSQDRSAAHRGSSQRQATHVHPRYRCAELRHRPALSWLDPCRSQLRNRERRGVGEKNRRSIHFGTLIDVSLFGCGVVSPKPFSARTKARIRITHRGSSFEAFGRVVYVTSDGEMGIIFTRVEPNDQLILEQWISELREQTS